MYKIEIKKDKEITNYSEFKTERECEIWREENNDYFPEGYEFEIINITSQAEAFKKSEHAKEFLLKSDWYVTRFAETNKAIPEEIIKQRQEARLQIIKGE
jgi:hypothetical protein